MQAGEGNSDNSVLSRLSDPKSFTGQYRKLYLRDEPNVRYSDQSEYIDPIRKGTRQMLMNRSSKKGELSIKKSAQNFRNEVEWRLSLSKTNDLPLKPMQISQSLPRVTVSAKRTLYPSRSNVEDMNNLPEILKAAGGQLVGLRD